jgi:YVTN family beta-propeller protein
MELRVRFNQDQFQLRITQLTEVYIANKASNNVYAISSFTNDIVASIAVGNRPNAIAYDSINYNLYVVNEGSDDVYIINGTTNKVDVDPITVGRDPLSVSVNPFSKKVYVTNSNSASVL